MANPTTVEEEVSEEYIGEVVNGKRHGFGMLGWGKQFQVMFKNGIPNKNISLIEHGREKEYVGMFYNNKKHGLGIITFTNQQDNGTITEKYRYEGSFENDSEYTGCSIKPGTEELSIIFVEGEKIDPNQNEKEKFTYMRFPESLSVREKMSGYRVKIDSVKKEAMKNAVEAIKRQPPLILNLIKNYFKKQKQGSKGGNRRKRRPHKSKKRKRKKKRRTKRRKRKTKRKGKRRTKRRKRRTK